MCQNLIKTLCFFPFYFITNNKDCNPIEQIKIKDGGQNPTNFSLENAYIYVRLILAIIGWW